MLLCKITLLFKRANPISLERIHTCRERMPNFTIRLSLFDSKTNDPVYFKQDGKRFGSSSLEERTLKLSTSVKYRVKVTVPSSVAPLR